MDNESQNAPAGVVQEVAIRETKRGNYSDLAWRDFVAQKRQFPRLETAVAAFTSSLRD